jgi:hypothetical protein
VNFACTAGRTSTLEVVTAKSAGDEHVTGRRTIGVSLAASAPTVPNTIVILALVGLRSRGEAEVRLAEPPGFMPSDGAA